MTSREQAGAALARSPERGALARGLGRSYGDLAQNGGGLVLDMTGLDKVREFDAEAGTIVVDGGCSLAQVIREVVPAGWFLPVTPGTRHVTVGGAIACDVHGKNHHTDGSFGRYVRSLTLLTPDGALRMLDALGTPSEFTATVGGLGLTGVIVGATLRLLPVETTTMRIDIEPAGDIVAALERLTNTDQLYRYSVAWVDCRARGKHFGRSVLMGGDHATLQELPRPRRRDALTPGREPIVSVPPWASAAPLIRGVAGDAFNALYFRRARARQGLYQGLDAFFYPLDALGDWNRLYGRSGFLQYQVVVPHGRERELIEVLRLVSAARPAPTLAVMKRFGEASGMLSFPAAGWTLALDLALPAPGLARTLDRADDLVAAAGGRVYLAKDARLRAELLHAMYPRLHEWRTVQAQLDPGGRMQGDLARRLDVTGRRAA